MTIGNDGEAAARLPPDLHRAALESAIDEAVAILDGAALVVGWNEPLARLTGCPPGRAMGRHASWFWPGWDGVAARAAGRSTFRASWRLEGGPPVEAEVAVVALAGGGDAPPGFALIVRPRGPGGADLGGPRLPADRERFFELMKLQIARMPLACFIHGEDFRITSWNPAAERMFGYTEPEAVGRWPYDLIVPDSARRHVEEIEQRLRSGDMSAHSVNENVTKDGRTILCRWTNTPLMDARGRFMGLLSTAEDVTERTRAEEDLRVSEHLFRAVFEGALEALLLADDDGRYTEANPAAGDLFGVAPDALVGREVREFVAPGFDFAAAWSGFLGSGRARGSFHLYRPDGTVREVDFNSVANVRPGRHLAVIRDITDWKREERGRIESERLTRSVLDSLPAHIAVLDEAGRILRVNRAWRDFARRGGARGPVSEGVNYLDTCDSAAGEGSEHAREIASGIRDVLAGRREAFAMEYPCRGPGRELWFRAQVDSFRGEGPPGVVVSHLDVTDRRATEDARKHYADRLEILRAVDRAILAARSPGEIASTILAHLAEHIPCGWGTVETFDVETGEARLLASHGATRGRPGADDDEPAGGTPAVGAPRGSLRIPLMHDGKPVGSLRIGSDPPGPLGADQCELAREVADQFAIALRQALLHEEIGSAKERLEKVSRRLIRAEEDERRRIARELHDEIGQSLTAVKIHIQAAGIALGDPPRARSRLEEGASLVERTLRQIRSISLDLRPSLLDDFGLVAALRSLLNTQARLGGFATHLHVVADDPEFRLEPELETACFRVAQEGLTNVVRHAGASYVEVEIRRDAGGLGLSVVDDGAGFDPEAALDRASSGESFGLLGIRERVALLGGHVDFHSAPGRGSKILARFPLAPEVPPPESPP